MYSNNQPYLIELDFWGTSTPRHAIQRGRYQKGTRVFAFGPENAFVHLQPGYTKQPAKSSGFENDGNRSSGNDRVKAINIKRPTKGLDHFKKAYQFVYQFFDSSSIHGFGQLTARKRHITEYVLWALFLLAAITGTLYIARQSWRRYQYFPTVIQMERDYKNWNTSFPTATVCPDEKLDEKKLQALAKKYNATNVDKFFNFFKQLANSEYDDYEFLPVYKEVRPKDFMQIMIEARFNFTYQVSNSYDSGSGELMPIVTEMGVCYTYNSEVAVHFSPVNFRKKMTAKHEKGKLIYGSPLDGELFSQIMSMNSGYNMTITGPYDIPDIATRRLKSEPYNYKTLEVTAVSIISSDSIRPLTIEQRKCRFYDESTLEISDVYTYIACRMQCRLDLAYKLCKCVPFFYKKPIGKPYCDVEGLRCLGRHGSYLIDLRNPETNEKVPCECYPLCNDVHFLIEMENTMAWKIATNLKWGMMRYPKIRLKREIIFGFSDLLVSVGGTAGFFLGSSLLSFIEILYFFTLRLIIFLIRQFGDMYFIELTPRHIPKVTLQRTRRPAKKVLFAPGDGAFTLQNSYSTTVDEQKLESQEPVVRPQSFCFHVNNFINIFFATSTIHGLAHLTAVRRHWTEHALWCLCIVSGVIGSLYISSKSWYRYQYDPIVVAMERGNLNWNNSVPSATICPLMHLNEEYVENWLNNLGNSVDKQEMREFIAQLANTTYSSAMFFTSKQSVIRPESFMKLVYDLRFPFSHAETNTIRMENGMPAPSITEFGICYIYNSAVSFSVSPRSVFSRNKSAEIEVSDNDIIQGNPMDGEVFATLEKMNSGFKFIITGPNDVPDVSLKSTTFISNTLTQIVFSATSIYSSDEIKSLTVKQRKCRFLDESNLYVSNIYTYNWCRIQCRVELVLKLCGCVPHFYKKLRRKKICGYEGLQCIAQNEDLLIKLRHSRTQEKVQCKCLPSCNDDHYTFANQLNDEWFFGTTIRWGLTKYSRIRLKRDIIFGFSELLVSIGGTAGLFLGCSVLSFIEIIYFLTLRLCFYISQISGRPRLKHHLNLSR